MTIIREPTSTTVLANCASTTVVYEKKVPVVVNNNTFGVAPWHRWAFFLTLGALVIALLLWWLTARFGISMARKILRP